MSYVVWNILWNILNILAFFGADGNESGGDEDLVGQPFASQNSVDHGNSEMVCCGL